MRGDPMIEQESCGPVLRVCSDTAWGLGTASFSACERYRFRLSRIWQPAAPRVAFLMLNPSTADAEVLDPTVRRCMGFAQAWGFGACEIVNVFALRSTDPMALYVHADPVGAGNDQAIRAAARDAAFVVAAWGVHAAHLHRDEQVQELLEGADLRCLKLTKNGSPGHPLYLPNSCQPMPWRPRKR